MNFDFVKLFVCDILPLNCRRLSDLLRLTMQCFNTVLTKLSKLLKFSLLQPKKRKEEEHQKLRYFKSFATFRKMTQGFFFFLKRQA